MKNFIVKYIPWIIIAAMLILLIPGLTTRINNEKSNKNVTVSVLYSNVANKVSDKKLNEFLDECKNNGIDTVSISEDNLNYLVSRGDVTSIKYNVLRHKYDDESMRVADAIAKNCPDVSFDSHIVLAKKKEAKEKVSYMLPRKYNESAYACIKDVEGMDIYVLYNGREQLWDYALGYDEKVIDEVSKKGFDIALVFAAKNYDNQLYLEDMDRLIKKYNIKYLNIKEAANSYASNGVIAENYTGLAKLINDNNMTLVVTENTNQLSNQMFFGYSDVFNSVMSDSGVKRVVRSYETYDDTQAVGIEHSHRVSQYFNSTIDRNIRFITLTQIELDGLTYDECADHTLMSAVEYKDKIEKCGYSVNGEYNQFDYPVNKTFNYAICAVIMVMFALIICQNVLGLRQFYIAVLGLVIGVLAFVGTYVIPESLINLYPTVYSAAMSCFVMTVMLMYVKTLSSEMPFILLAASTFAITVTTLILTSVGMGVMLSGINYYINNDIFRGIKISLLVPIAFTMVAYYLMFMRNKDTNILKTAAKVLRSDIKVYWVLIGGFIGVIGMYYIIRSGNVNSISSLELWLRNTVTEIFPERPRTKEFLIGYPALLLFVYYVKNYDIKLVNWILAVGASILAASVTNSFCHVFTDYYTIVLRTLNGLTVGVFVSIGAYIGNLILVMAGKYIKKRI